MDRLLDFNSDNIEAGVWPDAATFPLDVVVPRQTHTSRVGVIASGDAALPDFDSTDALVSFRRGLRIGVRTADCVPLLLHAPDIGAVAAIHAGWRGTLGGIVTNALRVLGDHGASMAEVRAAFGPSICGDCYEVGEDLAGQFRDAGFADCLTGTRRLDLEAVNTRRLLAAGLRPENISRSVACTMRTHGLPSWRREPGTTQRLLTHIMLL